MLHLSYLSLLFFFASPGEDRHAVYISVVEIEAEKIRVKVFSDDLRDAIRNDTGIVPDTAVSDFCDRHHEEIQQYFMKNLKIKINEKPVAYHYESASFEGDSYWINFGFIPEQEWKSIYIEDKHFMELFPSQSNIIKVKATDLRFDRLTSSKTSCSFEF